MKTAVLLIALLAICSATKQAAVVVNYIDDIIEGVTAEQLSHDSLFADEMDQCDDERAYRNQAIADGTDALNRATSHHDRCALNYADAEADLAQVRQNIAGIDATVAKLEQRRVDGRREYARVSEQLTNAISAVEECFPFIDHMENNASFAQVSKGMMGTFKTVAATGYGASMAGVLTAMVELSQSYDGAKVAEVRRLFNTLLQELRDSRSMAIEMEERAQAIHENAMTDYAGIKGTLQTQEAQLLDFSVGSENCVDQESFVIASANQKISNNTSLLEYADNMCNAFTDEYNTASDARKNELKLLHQIRAYVVDRKDEFDSSGLGLEVSGAFEEYAASYEEGESALQTGSDNVAMVLAQMRMMSPKSQKASRNLRRK